MTKFKGLGKGLDALLSSSNIDINSLNLYKKQVDGYSFSNVDIDGVVPGKYQPRKLFKDDALHELSNSIKKNGMVQPIIVRKLNNNYEIVAGERRWRAAKLAGLNKVPVIIRDLTDQDTLAIALIENIQRQDLNVIEEAIGLKRLVDEFELTHEELANVTGKSRSNITNTLRLLNLSDEVQDLLLENKLSMGHARALLPLDSMKQIELASTIIDNKLSTSDVEKIVSKIYKPQKLSAKNSKKKQTKDHDIIKLEYDLSNKFGMHVVINDNNNGGGKIIFNYSSLDELDALLNSLK